MSLAMQLYGLTGFTLFLILAFVSESLGQKGWTISVNRTVLATRGSEVIIHCKYKCPPLECNRTVSVHWKKRIGNSYDGSRLINQNEFVYHEENKQVAERYRDKTQLLKSGTNDCSLKIQNVTDNDQDLYVRLKTQKHAYSFYNDTVSIFVSVSVSNTNTPSSDAENTTMATTPKTSSATMYIAIFVPLAALLIIAILAGTFCFTRQKRKQSFTREESGYYANFSRASSNNAKSEVSCKKIDNLPEINDVEDPVYVNVKDPVDQMDQSINNTNNIYANVNYSR